MNTSELRIGNIILCNGKPEAITGVLQYGVYFAFGYCPNVNGLLQPVAITEKWMHNLGFAKDKYGYLLNGLHLSHLFELFVEDETGYNDWRVEIESVHQLQNLYFNLISQELKLCSF